MDVADVLRCAADAVDRSGVAGDLRAVAFTTAVELVLRSAGEAPLGRPEAAPEQGPERTGDRTADRPLDRSAGPALRLHGGEPRPSTGREHPAYGDADRDDDHRPWDLDHRSDHRADARADARADHRADHGPDWPEAPRVLRPLTSAAAQRAGLPRLAPRPDADDDGTDWSVPRRGPERLVAVGPRSWSGAPGAGEEPWGSIADALGVRPELLDRVWEERGGKLQLAGDPARLGRTRAQRVGTAAVLLLAALRWSGRDGGEPVPDAVVRAEVERLGLLDTGNYTKHLAGRRHLLSTTGSGRTATYKLRYDGLEEARVIARALLEEA
ncbi:hypothetical protein FHN55_17275 [Streptomyces sp. NP160]|uniref:hypothetical protein n=1 Tax=Streptomyces sp. NP160 TaxID=2586637 RepID=UPI00111A6CFF|nr:hypothetical protein [Streptomyces sp. NP160]TNM61107.1 hypothetical protein FHN55_17275 [Streptomyces sp. NP160]